MLSHYSIYVNDDYHEQDNDNKLITTVTVTDCAANGAELDIAEIKKNFKQFGEILAITKNTSDLAHPPSVNVIFKEPAAAASALKPESSSPHTKYKVSASDDWLQLLMTNDIDNIDESVTVATSIPQTTNLTDLNDDCLIKIFADLDLRDQLALALTDYRFMNAYEMFAKSKHKTLETDDLWALSEWQTQQFFIIVGKYIEVLSCDQVTYFNYICQLATAYCTKLEKMLIWKMREFEMAPYLNDLLKSQKNLKGLLLAKCRIKDDTIVVIANLNKLEILTLALCNYVTGRHLIVPNLKELNIIRCRGIDEFYVKGALERMPNLKALTLCDGLSPDLILVMQNLAHFSQNLERLIVRCSSSSYRCLKNMEKLKSINFCSFGYENFFAEFADSTVAKQLEELGIDCYYIQPEHLKSLKKFENLRKLRFALATDDQTYFEPLLAYKKLEYLSLNECQIHNETLLKLVINLPNLKFVNLQNTPIDNEFATNLLPMLNGMKKRPAGQLVFYAYNARIEVEVLENEYYTAEIESVVKFVFERIKRKSEMYLTYPFENWDLLEYFMVMLP